MDREFTYSDLTARERRVAELSSQGLTNREIADELHVSVFTVRNEIIQILRKLKLRNRSHLAYVVGRHTDFRSEPFQRE